MTFELKHLLMRLRVYLAVGLLLVPALRHSAVVLSRANALDPAFRATALVQAYDGPRFDQLRQILKQTPRIGFIDDPAQAPGEHVHRYYLTQYALAPVIVLDDPMLPDVLVNSSDPTLIPQPRAGIHYELVADAGGGVRLYHARSD